MNCTIVDSRPKPVNLLLGTLDENFEWDASKKLHRERRHFGGRESLGSAAGLPAKSACCMLNIDGRGRSLKGLVLT